MSKFLPGKIRLVALAALILLVGVSIWVNPASLRSQHEEITPPIGAPDPAGRLIQQASEDFFYREFPKAADNYRKAIALYEADQNFSKAAGTYESLGDLYKFTRDVPEAEASYLAAVEIHKKIDDRPAEARALKNIGNLYMKREQFETAGGWYLKAAKAIEDAPPSMEGAKVYEALGHYYWKTHNLPKAIDTFTRAQKDFAALKYEMGYNHMTAVLKKLNKEKDLPTPDQPDQRNL